MQAVDDVEGTDDDDQQNYEAQPQLLPNRIGFIGAGQMGEALIRGFTNAGVTVPDRLCASVRSDERRNVMQNLGLTVPAVVIKLYTMRSTFMQLGCMWVNVYQY